MNAEWKDAGDREDYTDNEEEYSSSRDRTDGEIYDDLVEKKQKKSNKMVYLIIIFCLMAGLGFCIAGFLIKTRFANYIDYIFVLIALPMIIIMIYLNYKFFTAMKKKPAPYRKGEKTKMIGPYPIDLDNTERVKESRTAVKVLCFFLFFFLILTIIFLILYFLFKFTFAFAGLFISVPLTLIFLMVLLPGSGYRNLVFQQIIKGVPFYQILRTDIKKWAHRNHLQLTRVDNVFYFFKQISLSHSPPVFFVIRLDVGRYIDLTSYYIRSYSNYGGGGYFQSFAQTPTSSGIWSLNKSDNAIGLENRDTLAELLRIFERYKEY